MVIEPIGNPENPAIILLNGTLCSGDGLYPISNQLKDDFYVILPTYDGCDGYDDAEYDNARNQAIKIYNWLRKNGVRSLTLAFGSSMGAEVLVEFALLCEKQGYQVGRYVFDGGPFMKLPGLMRSIMRKKFVQFATSVKGKDTEQGVTTLLGDSTIQMLTGPDNARYESMVADMVHVCQTATRRSIEAMVETCYTFDFPRMSDELQKKSVFIWCENELARKAERDIRRHYPKATYRIIPDWMHCGYLVNNPVGYAADLKAYAKGEL
jgi:pimeloyl-ACP methyl ester carboxylesterase